MITGCDPEVFIINKAGVILPSTNMIGGTKILPRRVNGGAVQEDNIMAELNPHPAFSRKQFIRNVTTVMDSLRYIIRDSWEEEVFISPYASGFITEEETKSPAGKMFGCEKDWCTWTETENKRILLKTTERFCAGHVHMAMHSAKTEADQYRLVRYCDKYLGIAGVIMDPDDRRYLVYGKAGTFRFKPEYPGIEYRTLSNFWIHSEELIGWVWDQVQLVEKAYRANEIITVDEGLLIQHCINTNNVGLAHQLVEEFNLELVA